MSNVKYIVDGQQRPLSEFGDNLQKGIEKLTREATVKRIESARCPVHDQSPRNVQMKIEGSKVTWTFEKCCNELERAVAATLK